MAAFKIIKFILNMMLLLSLHLLVEFVQTFKILKMKFNNIYKIIKKN